MTAVRDANSLFLDWSLTTSSDFSVSPHFAPFRSAFLAWEIGVGSMSVILNKLRILEAKRVSGALTFSDFEKQKSALLDDIPDAFESEPTVSEPTTSAKSNAALWDTLVLWIVGAVFCGTVTWAVTGNLGIAATLGITVLAAFTIKLFTALE
jgi:hypothetical protein